MPEEASPPATPGGQARRKFRTPLEARRIEELVEAAGKAVELLNVRDFLGRNADNIRKKLVWYEGLTEERGRGDVTFTTLSMPIASGVIHVASEPEDLDAAGDYLSDKLRMIGPNDDPFPVLAALVLIHIVHEGQAGKWVEVKRDNEGNEIGKDNHRETWQRLWKRVENAVRDIPAIPPAAAAATP